MKNDLVNAAQYLVGEDGVKELSNFRRGVEVIETTKDVKLYRYYGGGAKPISRYLTNGPISESIDRIELALPEKWNSMSGVAEISVPKGTIMIKGTVGSQKFPYIGGRTQYFVPSTDNLSKLK